MSIPRPPVRPPSLPPVEGRLSLRDRWRRRREIERDRLEVAEAVEREHLQLLLSDARRIVESSWLQGAWFAVRADDGRTRLVRSGGALAVDDDRIVGSCLVGAVIRAAGGTSFAQEQPVQRALEAVWHALKSDEGSPIAWNPPPMSRMQHVRDLTRWNDREAQSADEVASLLLTAERVVLGAAD